MNRRSVLGGVLALGGCAPVVQAPRPFASAEAPRFEGAALVAFDGLRLPLSIWTPQGAPRRVIVALHGMDDYANAFHLAGPWFASRGVALYAYDQRGFGRGPNRGLWAGEALMTDDLRAAVLAARAAYPDTPVDVLGESMGGAVAITAFASARPPAADRLVLAAPAVWGWSAQPPLYAASLWGAAHLAPAWRVTAPSWVARRIRASDNLEELRAMGRDRNLIFETRVDAIYGLVTLMQAASTRIAELHGPALYLYGAHDQVIPKPATFRAAARLPPSDRTAYYANGYHMLLRDLQREVVLADILSFLDDPAAPLPSGAPPIPRPRR